MTLKVFKNDTTNAYYVSFDDLGKAWCRDSAIRYANSTLLPL